MVTDSGTPVARRPFHLMTKPAGSLCNMACSYCYYLEKAQLYQDSPRPRMTDETLETYVRDYIAANPASEVEFAWQGGEPTLMGLEFFEKAVALQKKYAGGKSIRNALQTNATLLDRSWAEFFARHQFLIGVSIDGPRQLHDHYRIFRGGTPSFDRVMAGIDLLREAGADFNTLTVVNRHNSRHPVEVYEFLKEIGSGFLQFIPIVERQPDERRSPAGIDLAAPPDAEGSQPGIPVTPWSVRPRDFGRFLSRIYDVWIRRDVGRVFVQHFDGALGHWSGQGSSVCVFAPECGTALAVEHNGDVYACDHYVYPEFRLGNLRETPVASLVDSPRQIAFGRNKSASLPAACRQCPYLFACHGDCPKHRFVPSGKNQPPISYLCAGLKIFFRHIDPTMREMAHLLRSGHPPAAIMARLSSPETNSPVA